MTIGLTQKRARHARQQLRRNKTAALGKVHDTFQQLREELAAREQDALATIVTAGRAKEHLLEGQMHALSEASNTIRSSCSLTVQVTRNAAPGGGSAGAGRHHAMAGRSAKQAQQVKLTMAQQLQRLACAEYAPTEPAANSTLRYEFAGAAELTALVASLGTLVVVEPQPERQPEPQLQPELEPQPEPEVGGWADGPPGPSWSSAGAATEPNKAESGRGRSAYAGCSGSGSGGGSGGGEAGEGCSWQSSAAPPAGARGSGGRVFKGRSARVGSASASGGA